MAVVLLPYRTLICTEQPRNRNSITASNKWSAEGIQFENLDVQAVTTLAAVVIMVDRSQMADFNERTNLSAHKAGLHAGATVLLLATVLQVRRQQQQQQRQVHVPVL